ncbi:unnamed protein product [Schistosoma margrebowiei]|uniref:Uncharacterized protein n=1 Tax=Schistosoma margrebowiei TaxID=48269 RepID=A0AA84ZYU8_9TREM|nr:unnamed protein product [Schistosoma margrebowiei]
MGEDNVEEAVQQFLTSHTNTLSPNCQDEESPAESMFGRLIRKCFVILNPKGRMRGLQKNNEDNSVYACNIRPGGPPPQSEMKKNGLEREARRRSSRLRKQTKFLQINPKLNSYD